MSGGRMGGGRRGGGGDDPGGPDGAGGGRAGAVVRSTWLPTPLSIHAADGLVRLADTTGTEVAEILIDTSTLPSEAPPGGVTHLSGQWKGSRLEATFAAPEGAKIIETYSLKSKGRTLEIKTRVEPPGNRPSFSFKRVYEKMPG